MNQSQQYWFKRKTYGYGWTPANKFGWITTLVFLVLFIMPIFFSKQSLQSNIFPWKICCYWIALTMIFIIIAYKTGESPKWQWGQNKNANNQN